MTRPTLAAIALLLLSSLASAISLPVTQENDKIWYVYGTSFTSVTAQTVDVGGFATVGYSSITTNNINGFSYWIYPKGNDASFTIVQTTRTVSGGANAYNYNTPSVFDWNNTVAQLSTTTSVTIPANVAYAGKFEETTINPVFYFGPLSTAGTVYFVLEYAKQRKP